MFYCWSLTLSIDLQFPACLAFNIVNSTDTDRCHGGQIVLLICYDHRSEILSRLEQVLLLDLPQSHQKSVEHMMWKSVFYHVIEVLRQELAEFDDEQIRQQLLAVIDNVINVVLIEICLNIDYDSSYSMYPFSAFVRGNRKDIWLIEILVPSLPKIFTISDDVV